MIQFQARNMNLEDANLILPKPVNIDTGYLIHFANKTETWIPKDVFDNIMKNMDLNSKSSIKSLLKVLSIRLNSQKDIKNINLITKKISEILKLL
jgi:hypothetical protein